MGTHESVFFLFIGKAPHDHITNINDKQIMFIRANGKPKIEWLLAAASTAFANGGLVYWNGSGALIPADATSGDHAGVILTDILSTDSDYASTKKVPVDVPVAEDIFYADVITGTLTTAMVGNFYDIDATGLGLDVTATSKKVVQVVGFVSATKALVKINAIGAHKDVATT